MGRVKNDLISIQEEIIETIFPDKAIHELNEKEAEELYKKSVVIWQDRFDAYQREKGGKHN